MHSYKRGPGSRQMRAGVLALTLAHTLPLAGKTTNIPEGTAIIHSAVPLMTAEERSPPLGGAEAAGRSSRSRESAVQGRKDKGRAPIRVFDRQRVRGGLGGVHHQRSIRGEVMFQALGRGQRLQGQRLSGNPDNSLSHEEGGRNIGS